MTTAMLMLSILVIVTAMTLSLLLVNRFLTRSRNLEKRIRARLNAIEADQSSSRVQSLTPEQQLRHESLAGYANWLAQPLRYVRAAGIHLNIIPLIALSLAYVLASNLFIATLVPAGLRLATLCLLLLIPVVAIRRRHSKREASLGQQLPEALDVMSRSLQAGRPLMYCWREMGEALEAPLGPICRDIYLKLEFGGDLDDVLRETSDIIASEDVRFFLSSLSIQARSGGNLIALLQDQSNLLRERLTLKERIRTLSAESRLSAWIMGLMPFIVTAMMYLISPQTMSLLWTTPSGMTMLQVGLVMQLLGVFWIWRLVRIEV